MTWFWFTLGLSCFALSVVIYVCLYLGFRTSFLGLSFSDKIAHLISHVPDDDSPAWPHILAGVLFCMGLCLSVGVSVSSLQFVTSNPNAHSMALTASGLVFGVLISSISFWTLWQTKRIEQAQGSNINGFRELITAIAKEIEFINKDFRENNKRIGREHHRVFLVTTNPYFGHLSFTGDVESTDRFADAMRHAAENVHFSGDNADDERFKMEILCGDRQAIQGFHQTFYGKAGAQADQNDSKVVKASHETEHFLSELQAKADPMATGTPNLISRAEKIPKTQFAIVGNCVFEFILETPGYQSEIRRARRIREKVVCDRFRETFELLKEHLS
jgi:hypothetical protein